MFFSGGFFAVSPCSYCGIAPDKAGTPSAVTENASARTKKLFMVYPPDFIALLFVAVLFVFSQFAL
jgi:hypothetical protein